MSNRRGSVLLGVMVLVVVGALVAGASLVRQRAVVASARAAPRSAQSRALAMSGINAVLHELRAQRRAIMRGEEPRLTESWTLFDDGRRRGIIRLHLLDGAVARSENALIDLNTATREQLVELEAFEDAAIDAILSVRDAASGGLRSLDELPAEVRGEPLSWEITASANESGATARGDGSDAPSPTHMLTVWSFDPSEQSGVGEGDAAQWAERPRVNLNQPWSDALAEEVRARFGDNAVDLVRRLFESGQKFTSRADLVDVLAFFKVEPEQWGESLDAISFSDQPFDYGRVDLNRAPATVLAALPGIDRSAADRIVSQRELLEADQRLNLAWPVAAEILTPEQFKQCADRLTTRSTQWRVRVEGGIEATDPGAGSRTGDASQAVLLDAVILEAVFDLSSPAPRIAELRDVTHERVARQVTMLGTVEPTPPDLEGGLMPELVQRDERGPYSLTDRKNQDEALAREESGTTMIPADERGQEPIGGSGDAPSGPAPLPDKRHGRWRGG